MSAQPSAGLQTVSIDSLDSLALHVGFVGIALLFAYGCKKCLMLLENESEWLTEYKFFSAFPLFPFAMFGGILVSEWRRRPTIIQAWFWWRGDGPP